MFLKETSLEEIALINKKMKTKKCSGSDDISNEILKWCSPVVEDHLSKAFNECLEVGTFPECLKMQRLSRSTKNVLTVILKSTVRLVY